MLQSTLITIATLTTPLWAADTTCNPLTTTGCDPDTALATSFAETFTSESTSKWFTKEDHQGDVSFDSSNGLGLSLAKQGDNPTYTSNFYIMYGKVQVEMMAAPGTGVVSSFYLQSDDLDELDLEWLGGDNTQFQSDYFSQGKTVTYDRGGFHGVDSPTTKFHNYTIDWAMDQTTWSLDGSVVRTLLNTTEQGYPQTPMYIKFGIWAGGDPSNEQGTIEWAGGLTDYTAGPYTMYVKSVIVTDYSTGDQYSYSGTSGSWESIKAENGQVYGRYQQAQRDYAELTQGKSISSDSSTVASSTVASSTVASSTVASSTVASSTVVSSTVISSTIISSSVASSTVATSSEIRDTTTLASTSVEAATTEATTTEATTTEATTAEATTAEATTEATTTEQAATTTQVTTTAEETTSAETTSAETTSVETSSTRASSTSTRNSTTHSVSTISDDLANILSTSILTPLITSLLSLLL